MIYAADRLTARSSTKGTTAACIGMTRTNTRKKIAPIENTAPSRVDLSEKNRIDKNNDITIDEAILMKQ